MQFCKFICYAMLAAAPILCLIILAPVSAETAGQFPQEAAFLSENDAAMTRMMNGMAIKPTGNPDSDFAAMMIPHHQGAIDMAVAELRHGKKRTVAADRSGNHRGPAAGNHRHAAGPGPEAAAPRGPRRPAASQRDRNTSCPRSLFPLAVFTAFGLASPAFAGQAPGAASGQDIPISSRDRVYAAEQFSNTVSVVDPASNKLLGVIRLGDPQPGNFSPLYRGQLLVHGMGFLTRPQNAGGGFHRIQFGNFHRYGDQHRQTHQLCRPFAA